MTRCQKGWKWVEAAGLSSKKEGETKKEREKRRPKMGDVTFLFFTKKRQKENQAGVLIKGVCTHLERHD